MKNKTKPVNRDTRDIGLYCCRFVQTKVEGYRHAKCDIKQKVYLKACLYELPGADDNTAL